MNTAPLIISIALLALLSGTTLSILLIAFGMGISDQFSILDTMKEILGNIIGAGIGVLGAIWIGNHTTRKTLDITQLTADLQFTKEELVETIAELRVVRGAVAASINMRRALKSFGSALDECVDTKDDERFIQIRNIQNARKIEIPSVLDPRIPDTAFDWITEKIRVRLIDGLEAVTNLNTLLGRIAKELNPSDEALQRLREQHDTTLEKLDALIKCISDEQEKIGKERWRLRDEYRSLRQALRERKG